jgi:hypothetical protein
MSDECHLEPLFRVANVESIASYWYNGRLQMQLIAVLSDRQLNGVKMNATRLLLAALVLASVIGANQANAQCSSAGAAGSCNTTNTASVTVNALVKLDMGSTTTSLTSPTVTQVETGALIADGGPTFTIKANRSWTLNIKTTNASLWTYVGSLGGTKPMSDLTWSNAVGGSYVGIGSSDAPFLSGAAATNGTAAQAFFKTVWAAGFTQPSNAPGTYSLPIVFTLSAP